MPDNDKQLEFPGFTASYSQLGRPYQTPEQGYFKAGMTVLKGSEPPLESYKVIGNEREEELPFLYGIPEQSV